MLLPSNKNMTDFDRISSQLHADEPSLGAAKVNGKAEVKLLLKDGKP